MIVKEGRKFILENGLKVKDIKAYFLVNTTNNIINEGTTYSDLNNFVNNQSGALFYIYDTSNSIKYNDLKFTISLKYPPVGKTTANNSGNTESTANSEENNGSSTETEGENNGVSPTTTEGDDNTEAEGGINTEQTNTESGESTTAGNNTGSEGSSNEGTQKTENLFAGTVNTFGLVVGSGQLLSAVAFPEYTLKAETSLDIDYTIYF